MRLTVLLPTSTEVNSRCDGAICALRIGHVPLRAAHDEVAVEGAAPADFDGVAELILVARLGQDAVIELFSVLGRPLQQFRRAVDRGTFLVAGDQERDRALRLS